MTELIVVEPYVKKGPTGQREYGTPREIGGCKIWPRTSDDVEDGAILDGLNIAFTARNDPAFTVEQPCAVNANDRITARGKQWEVEGVPGDFRPNSGPKVILQVGRVGA